MATERNTTIRASQLRNSTVTADDIALNSITGDRFVDVTISGGKIAAGAVSESKMDIYNAAVDGYYLKYTSASGMGWFAGGGGVTDHGALTGLTDDDHTQYLLASGTRNIAGNITQDNGFYIATDEVRARDSGGLYLRDDSGTLGIFIKDGGRVGIDTTTPSGKLHVSGSHIFTNMGYGFMSYDTEGNLAGMYVNTDDSLRLVTDATPRLTISEAGNIDITGTVNIGAEGTLEGGQDTPTGSGVLGYNGYFYATRVYNAVYNDIADFQQVIDKIEYGKCYYDTPDGAKICTERCQMAVIGIASDTYGFGVGIREDGSYAPFAVAGWVLAHVDKEYLTGTPLTNNEEGVLTEILLSEKQEFPERIVAIYKKKEPDKFWGSYDEIEVNGRSWVKVK